MNKKLQLAKLNDRSINTLMETLDIKYTDIGEDFLVATMPVTSKVYQPTGIYMEVLQLLWPKVWGVWQHIFLSIIPNMKCAD